MNPFTNLPAGVCEQQRRADDSELRRVEQSAVENRFLHHVKARAADVIETVTERGGDERLHRQTAVVAATLGGFGVHRMFRRCADGVETRYGREKSHDTLFESMATLRREVIYEQCRTVGLNHRCAQRQYLAVDGVGVLRRAVVLQSFLFAAAERVPERVYPEARTRFQHAGEHLLLAVERAVPAYFIADRMDVAREVAVEYDAVFFPTRGEIIDNRHVNHIAVVLGETLRHPQQPTSCP